MDPAAFSQQVKEGGSQTWSSVNPNLMTGAVQEGISKQLLSHLYTSETIEGAARQLGVGVTALKKRCRELGIKRWPHRQVIICINVLPLLCVLNTNSVISDHSAPMALASTLPNFSCKV
jgi:hypothetical protein